MPGLPRPERLLVWIARRGDVDLTLRILEEAGHDAVRCDGLEDLLARLEEGAGCAIVAEEQLTPASKEALVQRLLAQPPWSDFPFIIFCARPGGQLDALGNVTRLDRPVRPMTLLIAVRSALRARRRQYDGEDAIRLRDQFLAMLGHELRNPLGAIMMAMEMLDRIGGELGKKQRAVIDRQARHLARLVDDLLDVSRVTAGKVALKRVPLDLQETVRRCMQSVEAAARSKSVQIAFRPAPETLTVHADPVRLEQVFNNLIINAIKYSPARSSVDVSISAQRGAAVVRVVDNGIGIAPELIGRIFDLFVQEESSLDRSQGGMGIGLTLVKRLVDLHGGTVEAYSEGRDRGSEFVVRLPLAERPQAAPDRTARPIPPHLPLRLVLVEDNADIRESLRDYLESLGHEVRTAADGPAGLAVILEQRPDVALVDGSARRWGMESCWSPSRDTGKRRTGSARWPQASTPTSPSR
jgi:signal transduction histidine kinase